MQEGGTGPQAQVQHLSLSLSFSLTYSTIFTASIPPGKQQCRKIDTVQGATQFEVQPALRPNRNSTLACRSKLTATLFASVDACGSPGRF